MNVILKTQLSTCKLKLNFSLFSSCRRSRPAVSAGGDEKKKVSNFSLLPRCMLRSFSTASRAVGRRFRAVAQDRELGKGLLEVGAGDAASPWGGKLWEKGGSGVGQCASYDPLEGTSAQQTEGQKEGVEDLLSDADILRKIGELDTRLLLLEKYQPLEGCNVRFLHAQRAILQNILLRWDRTA